MTSAEIEVLARESLIEYEERLKSKVKDIKPYDPGRSENVKCKVPGNFKRVSAEVLKAGIEQVLDSLAEKSSFTMSEPGELPPHKPLTADYNQLRITFFEVVDPGSEKAHIWIFCWYYSD